MFIETTAISDGFFKDIYGKRGTEFISDMPTFSIPFSIKDYPTLTKSFAFILKDDDAIPVCGFSWIHWLGANLKKDTVIQNESINASDFIQGKNDWGENLYGGMAPPNAPHKYDLIVYALDCELDLSAGFSKDDLLQKIKGHILDTASISGIYNN